MKTELELKRASDKLIGLTETARIMGVNNNIVQHWADKGLVFKNHSENLKPRFKEHEVIAMAVKADIK